MGGRYIYDIFLIWSGSYEELLQFYDHLNNNDRNVKLCMEHSKTTIHFLDLTIFKGKDGKLHTTVYRKTTDRNTMLKADSFHPNWLKIIYLLASSNALDVFVIPTMNMKCKPKSCSTDHTEIVHNAYRKAQSIPRSELLQRKK